MHIISLILECLGHCLSKLVHGCASQVSEVISFKLQFLLPALNFIFLNPQGREVRAQSRNFFFNQHFSWLSSWNLNFISRFHISMRGSNAKHLNTFEINAFLFGDNDKAVLTLIRMAAYYVYTRPVLVGIK